MRVNFKPPEFDLSKSTTCSGMFTSCYSLITTQHLTYPSVETSVQCFLVVQHYKLYHSWGCKLSTAAIVAVFNGLGAVTDKTITVSGNWDMLDYLLPIKVGLLPNSLGE